MSSPRETGVDWARTADVPTPVRWGEVEAEVLAREPLAGDRLGLDGWALTAFGWVWVALLATATWGAAVLGLLAVVIAGTRPDVASARDWVSVSRFPFFVSCIALLATVAVWYERGCRRDALTGAVGVIALASAALALVVRSSTDAAEAEVSLFVVAAGLCGLLGLVLVVLAVAGRKNPVSRRPPLRGPRSTTQQARYRNTRIEVIEVLQHRGLVKLDEADRTRMHEMPLGYWDELDDVDEPERRRILEMRRIGWREFDDSDRRPWPPSPSRVG